MKKIDLMAKDATKMFNYLFMLGLSEKEFQEHIDKLDRYKREKYQ